MNNYFNIITVMNLLNKNNNKYTNNIFWKNNLNNVREETEGFASDKVTGEFSLLKESRQ